MTKAATKSVKRDAERTAKRLPSSLKTAKLKADAKRAAKRDKRKKAIKAPTKKINGGVEKIVKHKSLADIMKALLKYDLWMNTDALCIAAERGIAIFSTCCIFINWSHADAYEMCLAVRKRCQIRAEATGRDFSAYIDFIMRLSLEQIDTEF